MYVCREIYVHWDLVGGKWNGIMVFDKNPSFIHKQNSQNRFHPVSVRLRVDRFYLKIVGLRACLEVRSRLLRRWISWLVLVEVWVFGVRRWDWRWLVLAFGFVRGWPDETLRTCFECISNVRCLYISALWIDRWRWSGPGTLWNSFRLRNFITCCPTF